MADDDHLARAQAEQALVDALEAGGHAELAAGVGRVLAEVLVEVGHDLLERLLAGLDVAVGDVEQQALGAVHDLLGVLGRVEGERRYLRGGVDHLAQRGVAVQHLHVAAPAHQRERVVAQPQQEATASHALELAGGLEVVGERDGVDREVLVEHLPHGHEDGAVGREVEVVRVKVDQALLQGVRRDHHGREDRGLRLRVLGHGRPLAHGHPRRINAVVALCHTAPSHALLLSVHSTRERP